MIHRPGSRRWFQFSLGSLFWLTLLAATAAYALREHRERLRLEQKLLPSSYYLQDGADCNYFPPGPEFKLSREAAAMKTYAVRKGNPVGPLRVDP
jgi:hypothetical protein